MSWGFRDKTPIDISCIPDTKSSNEDVYYSAEFKIRTCVEFLLSCNTTGTARKMGIKDETTLRDWLKADWWPTCVAAAREYFADDLTSGFSRLVKMTQDALEDRIVNGDFLRYEDKIDPDTGEVLERKMIRRPIGARDLALIGGLSFDKRQIATGNPTTTKTRYMTAAERADRMKGVVSHKREPITIEAEKVDQL